MEARFQRFINHEMYTDLCALNNFLHAHGKPRDFRLILSAIPVRSKQKLKRFVSYKLDLLHRYRAGEAIDETIINCGMRFPILTEHWRQHTCMEVSVVNGKRVVSTLEDRLNKLNFS